MTVETEVPPNTSASVSLSGHHDGLIEDDSGSYHWSYPYQTPQVTHPPLTLDSTLGDLIDNAEAYALVMSITAPHSPAFMDRIQGQTEITLRQALYHNPRTEKLGAKIGAALASLGQ